jgi:DNA-binding transcriptional MerR regulator
VRELHTIGEFSRLTGLTIKALRHYDRLGVLRPAHVEPRTGYRYYDPAQVDAATELRALLALGIPLSRAGRLLADPSPRTWRAALLAARLAAHRRVVADEARLVSIEARLARLTFAGPDPANRPFLTRQPGQLVAAVRRDLQSFGQIEHLIGEVGEATLDATTHGVIWHDCGKLTGLGLAAGAPSAAPQTLPPGTRVDTVATGLEVPWGIGFAGDGRVFPSERAGRIRVMENGALRPGPWATLPVAGAADSGAGLLGLALDPEFASSHHLYVMGSFPSADGTLENRLYRLTDSAGVAVAPELVLGGLPSARAHAGSAVAFGPDGFLYATLGDAFDPESAQDPARPGGKILRLERDGTVPRDNPRPARRCMPVVCATSRGSRGIPSVTFCSPPSTGPPAGPGSRAEATMTSST